MRFHATTGNQQRLPSLIFQQPHCLNRQQPTLVRSPAVHFAEHSAVQVIVAFPVDEKPISAGLAQLPSRQTGEAIAVRST
jgi:hypothetical protein